MSKRLLFATAAVLAGTLALASCKKPVPEASAPAAPAQPAAPITQPDPVEPAPPAAPLTGFFHQPGVNLFGYYFAKAPIQFGNFKLRELHLGTAEEFASYEKGQRISPNYAPVMLEFDDVTSPRRENELGQPYHEVSRRVLPTAYRVTAEEVRFHGRDEMLGEVSFNSRLDAKALERVRAGGAEETVLTGTLAAMGQKLNRAFVWFGGD
ncbi:hypothetical protein [Phenylobacterium sp.]|uniref:hypothetical protein n=1 Tax=Phenylobacterium sp. TaxID=1871053 RepID=UPI0030F431B2